MVHHHGVQQKHTLIYDQQHKLMTLTWVEVPLHLFQSVSCKRINIIVKCNTTGKFILNLLKIWHLVITSIDGSCWVDRARGKFYFHCAVPENVIQYSPT